MYYTQIIEDFSVSKHFRDDGLSLGPATRENRMLEQEKFITAFNKSSIKDKRIICVTDKETGEYRNQEHILMDAIR